MTSQKKTFLEANNGIIRKLCSESMFGICILKGDATDYITSRVS
jgi:hypothetical protein